MIVILIVAALTIGQASDYVAGYDPKPGDRLVLGGIRDVVPVGSNYFSVQDLEKFLVANDQTGLRELTNSGKAALIDANTPILFIRKYEQYKDADLAEVRVLEGPYRDKVVFTFVVFCRKIDTVKQLARGKALAEAKARADAKARRGPLDGASVVQDLNVAMKRAKAEASRLTVYQARKQKEIIMRKAIESVCKKHFADLEEINEIATAANVFVNFDGQKYNMMGEKVR